MKRIILIILTAAVALSLCACGSAAAEKSEKGEGLYIIATVFPAYDFARQIAGEKGTVSLLIPPGSEAHSFEPTPRDIVNISECDLLIANGGESEEWLDEILEGIDEAPKIVYMLDCVEALTEEIKLGMQTKEEGGDELDEHVWTSPLNAVLISEEICRALGEIDSGSAAYYENNCSLLCDELRELDEAFRAVIDAASRKTLIFADRFPVRYFTEEYALDYYAAFPGCAEDVEPSAKTVAYLIDRVREDNIPAVLYIEFSNEKMADIIVEDTGCKKLLFHSCHNVTPEQLQSGVSYVELMRGNIESVKEALG